MSFGSRLQTLRHSQNLTQEEFARQLSVSRQAVSKWESSRGYPEIEKIIYICNRYHVSMDELFADEVPGGALRPHPDKDDEGSNFFTPSLKKSFSNFFSNLSPNSQLMLGLAFALFVIILLVLLATIVKGDVNQMVLKIIWAALLVVFTIGEGVTVGLTSIWFAAGALGALICSLLGGPLWLQIGLFIVISALSLLAIRPLAQKYLNTKVEPTNADRVIGSTAKVTEEINNIMAQGAVSIAGMTWSARSSNDCVIPAGTLVRVLRIEGVKVYVEQVEAEAQTETVLK